MWVREVRSAIRALGKSPGFALAVILTLGLGIGVNTAVFSALRGVLLKPLPHRDGSHLVYLRQSAERTGEENVRFSVPEVVDLRTASKTLTGFAEFSAMTFNMVGGPEPVQIFAGIVTGNYFEVMGLTTVLGRAFNQGDDGPGAAPVMVLTHEYWRDRFGGDPGVVGRTVRVNGRALAIVGVLQPAPHYPQATDVFVNMVTSPHHLSATMVQGRSHRMTELFARLAPGATLPQVETEIGVLSERVYADHPESYEEAAGYEISVRPLRDALTSQARLTLLLLMGVAGFVLLIALANVANLTLMRGIARERELAVRWALGAGGWRLRRLLLVENLLLALGGAALGLLLAWGSLDLLVRFAQRFTARAGEIRIDGVVLTFTVVIALAGAIGFAFAPRLSSAGGQRATLGGSGRRTTGDTAGRRLQRGLVISQLAVTVVVLTGAGLLVRTLINLYQVDTGVDLENVLTLEVPIEEAGRAPGEVLTLYEEIQRRIAALPQVAEVGIGSSIPLRRSDFMLELAVEGRQPLADEPTPRAEFRTATPEYFSAAGIPLVQGRAFLPTDRAGTERVAILNRTLADRLFPDEDPLGRMVAWTGDVLRFIPVSGDWRRVVGVVADTRDGGPDAEPRAVMFQPFAQEVFTGGYVIRTRSNAAALATPVTSIIRELVPEQPLVNVLTLAAIREETVAPRRLNAWLVASFAGLALLIAAVGVGGVLAFSVARRVPEIGIRISLGAYPPRVLRMVLAEGGAQLAVGIGLGLAAALLAARLMTGLLFGVATYDPVTLAGVTLLIVAVGLGACAVPAVKAARVDPVRAIQSH
jgi:predicted permease